MIDKSTQRECNILFLGESQSGKSTLIEFLKKYADPEYNISRLNVGDGIFSCTKNVMRTTIHTDLPTSYVQNKTGDRVDYGKFLEDDQEDYEDELNERRAYTMEREKSASDKVTFNLYDTPGLNDTTLFDEKNIAIIFSALEKEKVPSINLVVITVANNPFTEDLQNALKAYVNLLPDLNGNIVFVHTRIDYSKLHPDEESFVLTLKEKKRILHQLMGRDTVPHVLIDNDIGSTRVIRNCMTQNRLRELLAMAKLNQPVTVRVMVMNKTEKMKIVDVILQDKFKLLIEKRENILRDKNKEEEEVLKTIGLIEAEIIEYESVIQNIARDLAFYDKEVLCLLYEERYDQTWSMMKISEPKTAMYYPGRILSRSVGFVNHTLDHIDTQEHNIKVARRAGGVGEDHWAVQFQRRRFQDGVYHVKIYIKKSKMYSADIEKLRTKASVIKDVLDESREKLLTYNEDIKEIKNKILELVMDLELDRYVLGRVSTRQVHSKVFHALVDADVYVREDSISAKQLEEFYIKKRFDLDNMEKVVEVGESAPLDTSETTADGSAEVKEQVDYGQFIESYQEDYVDELNERNKYRLERGEPAIATANFNLIDTPGLKYTVVTDETNIAKIFKGLEGIRSIGLVVIAVTNNSFTVFCVDAFRACINLLPELNSNIVLFTPDSTITGCILPVWLDTVLHLMIDNDIGSTRTIRNCITQNTLRELLAMVKLNQPVTVRVMVINKTEKRKIHEQNLVDVSRDLAFYDNESLFLLYEEQYDQTWSMMNRAERKTMYYTLYNILGMAKFNQPIPVQTMHMTKTEKMRYVDLTLRDKYEASVKARLETLGTEDQKQRNLLDLITKKEVHFKAAKEYLRVNDNDSLELLHEELYQQDFSILNMMEGAKPLYYPGKKRALEPGFMHHILDHLDIRTQNIKVLQEAGGKGEAFWAVKFRRRKRQNGIYHVKIYITRRKKFVKEIKKMKMEASECEWQLEDHRCGLKEYGKDHRVQTEVMKELLEHLKEDRYLLNRTAAIQLDNQIFHSLVKAAVYVRDLGQSALNVEKFYVERREQLEALGKNTHEFVVAPPVNTSDDFDDSGCDIGDCLDISHAEFESIVKSVSNDANDALANLEKLKLQDKGNMVAKDATLGCPDP
ncbi:hypothetical protein BG000_008244 [Podila horticola]|nr:hypothetical protein BG000_008244 [Podila horticola]